MEYTEAINTIKEKLKSTGTEIDTNLYDGIIVKKLAATNTLDSDRPTHQTHIAITGKQMDIFPYLCADGYFYQDGAVADDALKKYFVIKISMTLFESNYNYLGNASEQINFVDGKFKSSACVVRSKREGQSDQLQLSLLEYDGPEFVSFRKLLHTGSYLVILKCKKTMDYHVFGIKANDVKDNEQIANLNGEFYKLSSTTLVSTDEFDFETKNDNYKSYNIIYYGVPGCGKSFKVEKMLQDMRVDTEDIFRTTFYLDYSNTDFIGQIYPTIDGDNVEYKPIPGPFTKALERALRYKEKTVYLVIEEINRGNAAAIFGDLFQLLDRLKKDYDGRIVGDSEYPISNEFIEGYFIKQNETYKAAGEPEIEFKRGNIYIPHNLVIYATMNTSDQNVFPLDTAFKRRWQRERVLSDWSKSNAGYNIPGSKYTWYEFAEGINELIRKHSSDGSMTEDKCLGSFFATPNMLLIGTETSVETKKQKLKAFVNNVVDYLYNDVTKFDHKLLFVNTVENYEKMYNEFDSYDFSSELDLSRWFNKEVIDSIDSKKR